jgi:hypothetical protein
MQPKNGPFLFSDYWATIMGFKNIMSDYLFKTDSISLELFRKGLDRPKTALPRIGNYILPPGIMLGKMLKKMRKAKPDEPSHADVLRQRINARLEPMKLVTEPVGGENSQWIEVKSKGETVATDVLNPETVEVFVSKFLSTWKVLIAFALTILFSVSIVPIFHHPRVWKYISTFYPFLFYPLLASFLYLVFRDFLAATVAPLPVLVARSMVRFSGVSGFILFMVGIGLLVFFIQCFFIPKSMPPTLYFYVNDVRNRFFPYKNRHAPYWLKGKCYWVWRFMTYSPAQLSKFWERDWERIEVWVRADKSPEAGNIEWLVADYHYRELWYDCSRQVDGGIFKKQQATRRAWLVLKKKIAWLVLIDMDVLFHTPALRGIVLTGPERWMRSAVLGGLRAFVSSKPRDHFANYRDSLHDLEIEGNEFFEDVPEHFRNLILRRLIEEPWSFWRYPRGATAALKIHLYSPESLKEIENLSVSDSAFQIKAVS